MVSVETHSLLAVLGIVRVVVANDVVYVPKVALSLFPAENSENNEGARNVEEG